jgi:hypothetical protein
LLLIRFAPAGKGLSESKLSRLCERLEKFGGAVKSVEMIRSRQKGIWAMFEGVIAASWIFPAHDFTARARVQKEVATLIEALPAEAHKYLGRQSPAPRWIVHEGFVGGGERAGADWEEIFFAAQAQWRATERHSKGEEPCDEFSRRRQVGS